jgi:DNA ligase (NAD+)
LAGKVIVVTGKVEQFENRAAIQAFIEQNGGIFGTAVTQKTDYLVTNDPFSGSTKNRKAKGLGVKVITEQELIDMVGR